MVQFRVLELILFDLVTLSCQNLACNSRICTKRKTMFKEQKCRLLCNKEATSDVVDLGVRPICYLQVTVGGALYYS